ncbi:Cro/CI family transcriptional regulator [Massilia sp.]|uniref:Cro/CI family transcriptional regulator n=1 Tax=Massilia sp. TaxID=1882437 RepID=UPI00352C8BA4
MSENNTPDEIIDALGGTSEVAKLCRVSDAAVSQWRRAGIPQPRLMYLEAIRPDLFALQPTMSPPTK